MRPGRLVVFTNPISKEREAEYHNWYNNIHAAEVCAIPGFTGMTRFKLSDASLPGAEPPAHRYLAIYDIEDMDKAMAEMPNHVANMTMTDAADTPNAVMTLFEPFFTYKK